MRRAQFERKQATYSRLHTTTPLPRLRLHDLRHTWASWHVQGGTPLFVLQEMGGWASAEMVRRYAHLGTGNYNALQVQLDKRYTNGFTYQVAYTWSKAQAEDDGWFGVEGIVVQNPYDPGASRGNSGTNVPNVLSANALYELPIGAGKKFSTGNRFSDYVLGNWQLNSILTFRNGQPYTVTDGADIANIGNTGYERANLVGNPNIGNKTRAEWFNTAAYAIPAQYTYGDGGRNTQQAQKWIDVTASVIRSFPLKEQMRFEFRAEAFNMFNHPIFGAPGSDLNSPTSFGAIGTNQANLNRILQVSGKFVF